jgi:hypothetical protein
VCSTEALIEFGFDFEVCFQTNVYFFLLWRNNQDRNWWLGWVEQNISNKTRQPVILWRKVTNWLGWNF